MNYYINPDESNLDRLNKEHNWIPNSSQVRRSNSTEDKYQDFIKNELVKYESKKDYIIKTLFDSESIIGVLSENMFPYQVSEGTYHYIMWYLENPMSYDLDYQVINLNILTELKRLNLYKENLEYVWYENPKRSGDLYHVHVFFHYK
jgi:hypothetical protein